MESLKKYSIGITAIVVALTFSLLILVGKVAEYAGEVAMYESWWSGHNNVPNLGELLASGLLFTLVVGLVPYLCGELLYVVIYEGLYKSVKAKLEELSK
jgi:hypothetical protein